VIRTIRVWGIPCPGDPDDERRTRAYRAWFWLYQTNQQARHRLGLHQKPPTYSIAPRCDWCGHRNQKQREIADANWKAFHNPSREEQA
jgi:hypothetical protein